MFHLILAAAICTAIVVPFWMIFKRIDLPPALALLAVIPFVALVFLWVIALRLSDGRYGPGR